MPTKPVTLRLPAELLEAIDEQVNSSGTNRTEVVVKALQEVFSREPGREVSSTTTTDDTLLQRIEALEAKVSKVTDRVEPELLSRLTARVNALEEELTSAQTSPDVKPSETPTAPKRQKKNTSATSTPKETTPKETAPKETTSKAKDSGTTTSGRRGQGKGQKKTTTAKESPKTKTSTAAASGERTPTKRRTSSKSTKASNGSGAKTQKRGSSEWLTVKEAFEQMGGNPADPDAVVTSLDGSRSVKFNRFRVLSASDYQAFGLEFRPDRRRRRLPCLRQL